MFVVDTSVIIAWCLEDEASDIADVVVDRLMLEGGIAPAHWPLEIANALRSAERRGRVDEPALRRLRPRLSLLPVEVAPVELSTAIGVIDTARRYDLSVYDAAYLDLADIRAVGLATVDGRLADACRSAGVPLIAA
jgi:predicted nucleic acid-binding protein